ncbi:hypothetical protein WG66_010549, partial [Moniliophthora roreri]
IFSRFLRSNLRGLDPWGKALVIVAVIRASAQINTNKYRQFFDSSPSLVLCPLYHHPQGVLKVPSPDQTHNDS